MATPVGDYALNRAIRCHQWGCVALLLETDNINTNALDVNRDTPLLLAVKLCHKGGMQWISALLKKKADYTVRDAKGKRVLDVARDSLDFDCLKVSCDFLFLFYFLDPGASRKWCRWRSTRGTVIDFLKSFFFNIWIL